MLKCKLSQIGYLGFGKVIELFCVVFVVAFLLQLSFTFLFCSSSSNGFPLPLVTYCRLGH